MTYILVRLGVTVRKVTYSRRKQRSVGDLRSLRSQEQTSEVQKKGPQHQKLTTQQGCLRQ